MDDKQRKDEVSQDEMQRQREENARRQEEGVTQPEPEEDEAGAR